MTTREIIRNLCAKKGISVQKLEQELGLSNGSIAKTDTMKSDRLLLISKYFNVSMEFLMGEDIDIEKEYYMDPEAKEMAQFLLDNPEYKVLFDASRKVKPEDLKKAVKALGLFTEEDD